MCVACNSLHCEQPRGVWSQSYDERMGSLRPSGERVQPLPDLDSLGIIRRRRSQQHRSWLAGTYFLKSTLYQLQPSLKCQHLCLKYSTKFDGHSMELSLISMTVQYSNWIRSVWSSEGRHKLWLISFPARKSRSVYHLDACYSLAVWPEEVHHLTSEGTLKARGRWVSSRWHTLYVTVELRLYDLGGVLRIRTTQFILQLIFYIAI